MALNRLSLKDRDIFDKYLLTDHHQLCAFSFENIYIWRSLFQISWFIFNGDLCIFFKDKIGCFMYLPPLGGEINQDTLKEAFAVMDGLNSNKEVSRIENIEEKTTASFRQLKFRCREKYPDYVCLRDKIAKLNGNQFKHKRAARNYFIKNYRYDCRPLRVEDGGPCWELFSRWQKERQSSNTDPVYRGMLQDSGIVLKDILDAYEDLRLEGMIVEVDGRAAAFTFGYKLNKETFCVLYEITDLKLKGLSQFIFSEFCRKLQDYRYINIMDDSGLQNLKRAKMAFRPVKLIANYIATR